MTPPPERMPGWLMALLAIELVVGLLAAILLAVVFLAFTTQPSSIDMIFVFAVAALPLVVTAGAVAAARYFWRRAAQGAAFAAAVLPLVLGLPFLAMLLGVSI